MDLGLRGKTAFVTGGAQGIGAAVADRLAAAGVRLAVADLATDELTRRADRWRVDEREPLLVTADLAVASEVTRTLTAVTTAFGGPPDLLVNNVGGVAAKDFADLTDADWQRTFDLNLMSHVRVCRALLPSMRSGAVVTIGSDLAKQPEPVPADYGAMKAAVLHLTKSLALRYAPAVRSNAVLPGPVRTGLWDRPGGLIDTLAEEYGTDRDTALERYLRDRQLPLGLAQPDDVAHLVAYLLSPLARRVNGSAFDVGGTVRGLI